MFDHQLAKIPPIPEGHKVAVFAGGCFWCMEPPFDMIDGVIATTSGFSGGHVKNPSYKQVVSGGTGHLEAIHLIYNPEKVSYRQLVDAFWRTIDPTQADGQFVDRGEHYKTAIFVANEQERADAEASKKALEDEKIFDKPIATVIKESVPFYPAEEYHQDYYKKNSGHYNRYKAGSGRAGFLKQTYGK